MDSLDRFRHSAWITGVATALSYGLGLLAMFVLLFLVPFVLFLAVSHGVL